MAKNKLMKFSLETSIQGKIKVNFWTIVLRVAHSRRKRQSFGFLVLLVFAHLCHKHTNIKKESSGFQRGLAKIFSAIAHDWEQSLTVVYIIRHYCLLWACLMPSYYVDLKHVFILFEYLSLLNLFLVDRKNSTQENSARAFKTNTGKLLGIEKL